METSQTIDMLAMHDRTFSNPESWIDLGCGTGTFTRAIARLLESGSRIIAIDKDRNSLNQMPDQIERVHIEKIAADFLDIQFPPGTLDGILMANSLHYVRDQQKFIETFQDFLKPDGCFLIFEYDTDISNPWIPYPIDFEKLKKLFTSTNFSSIKKIREMPSRYNPANLYSALIEKSFSE